MSLSGIIHLITDLNVGDTIYRFSESSSRVVPLEIIDISEDGKIKIGKRWYRFSEVKNACSKTKEYCEYKQSLKLCEEYRNSIEKYKKLYEETNIKFKKETEILNSYKDIFPEEFI